MLIQWRGQEMWQFTLNVTSVKIIHDVGEEKGLEFIQIASGFKVEWMIAITSNDVSFCK